jgi:hypothetical protein
MGMTSSPPPHDDPRHYDQVAGSIYVTGGTFIKNRREQEIEGAKQRGDDA